MRHLLTIYNNISAASEVLGVLTYIKLVLSNCIMLKLCLDYIQLLQKTKASNIKYKMMNNEQNFVYTYVSPNKY